ncbi:PAS domain-containing protein [Bradyrhizobium frederickii]|uniref:PAS domain-containing protein n=1 Tax=Bradyrhizobium frederickii TaxID=2560054 RepID=A0A4Y9L4R3_9BRAD|nr:PAS domain-containing protein [Bradyrhizobium frederickii]TFV37677.1 PAS domain-containing protein [Bradyrhizobium frederickii]
MVWNIVLDFASAAPSVVKSIRQRDLLNTWLRLYARQQIAPAVWEYQPARLEEELSDLIYYTVDTSTPAPRLTIQSANTRISRAYGHTGKGVLLEEYLGPRLAPFVMPIYHECVARGLPVYSVADVDDIYGHIVAYERLLLPFQTDGKVCHVIASVKTFCEDGGFEIKNLMRGNDALPRPKLRALIDRELFHRAPGRIATAEMVEFADQPAPGVANEIIELN